MSTDPLRVLHVDDDPSQLQMLKLVFEHLDPMVEVKSCNSPQEAIKLVSKDGLDCVVSDYIMPGLNGIDLAEKILAIKNIPFILYTGQGSEEVAQRAFQTGIHDYIRKEIEPTHYDVLMHSIKQAVHKHRAEQIYKVVFDSNPDAIFVVYDDKISYANKSAVDLFGVRDVCDLLGTSFIDYVVDGDPDELTWISLQRIISENSVIPFEFNIRGQDDKIRRVMGNLQNMLFMGNPSQIYFLKDVTSVRRIESSLLHVNHRFDKLFELSPIGLAFVTLSGKLVKSNNIIRTILGLHPDCEEFRLFQEPEFYRRIASRVMDNDSVTFDFDLSPESLSANGYLETSLESDVSIHVIISPVLDEQYTDLFLLQIQSNTD